MTWTRHSCGVLEPPVDYEAIWIEMIPNEVGNFELRARLPEGLVFSLFESPDLPELEGMLQEVGGGR